MEKKFTRVMVCGALEHKCKECPLFSGNNPKSLPCWLLGESDIQDIMKDYPYVDVKVRMIFNDIETRLTAVERKVSESKLEPIFEVGKLRALGDEIGIISGSYVDEKLYDKLEAKHEADCRLISEYDLEIKKLEKRNAEQNDLVCDLYSNLCTEQKERIRCEAVIEDKNRQIDEWEKRYKELEYMYEKKDAECNGLEDKYRRHNAELKSRLFDLKNVENERDHYKGLYSSKCDDYDKLLEKQMKTQKDFTFYRNAYYECCSANDDHIEKEHDLKEENIKLTEQKDRYKDLFHSLNHKHQKLVGEHKRCEEELKVATDNERYLRERVNKAEKLNKKYDEELTAIKNSPKVNTYDYVELMSKYKDLEEKLKETEEKFSDACVLNKMREDVFEAKDREIGLLRAELDKYKTDDECDDRWMD